MTLRTRLHKLCAARFEMSTSDWVEKIMKEVKKELISKMPASNRKSCPIGEHYFSRFKEGWNRYRHEALQIIEETLRG